MTNTTSKRTSVRYALACLAALAVSGAAVAATPTDSVPSVRVSFSDLDMSTEAGANTLYRRITSAARQVCPNQDTRDLALTTAAEHCQAQAVARAVSGIHSPQLALMFAAHTSHG
jgi:UrcA family protein